MKPKGLKKHLVRNFLILIGLLIFVDLVLHVIFHQKEYTYFYPRESGYSWDEDPDMFWYQKKKLSKNFSAAAEFPQESRIYCFGGSIVQGDFATTSFCKEMESCLPKGMRTFNFGMSGFTSHQSLALFRRVVAKLPPGVAIVSQGWNDNSNAPYSDKAMAARNHSSEVRLLYFLSHSKTVQLLRAGIRRARGGDPSENIDVADWTTRVSKDDYRWNLEQFTEVATEYGIKLVFVTQAIPDGPSRDKLRDYFSIMESVAASRPRVGFFDVRPIFESAWQQRFGRPPVDSGSEAAHYFFVDLCHLNDFGHRFEAGHICDYLEGPNL